MDATPEGSQVPDENPPILVFDNTKFSFANYGAALDELTGALASAGRPVAVITRSIRGGRGEGLDSLADELAAQRPGGVVLGFADAGVTPATTRLGLALHRRGVRTVVLAGDPGIGLARQIVDHQGPDLPIVHLPLRQWMSESEVRTALRSSYPEVLAGLDRPTSAPAGYPSGRPEVPRGLDATDIFEWLEHRGISDGLPVIPPTDALVDQMLASTDRPPDRGLVSDLAPSGRSLTVEDAAVGAVLAGCLPSHFPFVVTALEAMASPEFALWQAATSTNPSGTLILASGDLAEEAGIHGGAGCLGPGFRANAAIGRAVNLALLVASGAAPGIGNLATQGSPAQLSYCFAENRAASPWPGLHSERAGNDATTVTVFQGEGPHNVVDMVSNDAAGILSGVASTSVTRGSNNAYLTGELVVVLCPDHAEIIHRSGWNKRAVQEFLFESVRIGRDEVAGRGQVPVRPQWADSLDPVPAVLSPDDVTVVVAGGHGGHSSVVLPWAMNRSVTRLLETVDGRPARTLRDLTPSSRPGRTEP